MNRANQLGMSLVGVLVSVAILGILAVGASSMLTNMMKSQSHVDQESERESIRQMIRARLSCDQTLGATTPVNCGALPAFLTLTDNNKRVIAAGSGTATRIGKWNIRATCDSANNEIDVRLARAKSGVEVSSADPGDFLADPLNHTTLDWEHPKAKLFPTGAGPCKPNFNPKIAGFCSSPGVARSKKMCDQAERLVGYDVDTKQICCILDSWQGTVSWPQLTARHNGCALPNVVANGSNGVAAYQSACVAASRRWCLVRGYNIGVITEYNPSNAGVSCGGRRYP